LFGGWFVVYYLERFAGVGCCAGRDGFAVYTTFGAANEYSHGYSLVSSSSSLAGRVPRFLRLHVLRALWRSGAPRSSRSAILDAVLVYVRPVRFVRRFDVREVQVRVRVGLDGLVTRRWFTWTTPWVGRDVATAATPRVYYGLPAAHAAALVLPLFTRTVLPVAYADVYVYRACSLPLVWVWFAVVRLQFVILFRFTLVFQTGRGLRVHESAPTLLFGPHFGSLRYRTPGWRAFFSVHAGQRNALLLWRRDDAILPPYRVLTWKGFSGSSLFVCCLPLRSVSPSAGQRVGLWAERSTLEPTYWTRSCWHGVRFRYEHERQALVMRGSAAKPLLRRSTVPACKRRLRAPHAAFLALRLLFPVSSYSPTIFVLFCFAYVFRSRGSPFERRMTSWFGAGVAVCLQCLPVL